MRHVFNTPTIIDPETGREYPIIAGGSGNGSNPPTVEGMLAAEQETQEETPPEPVEEVEEDEDEPNFNGETFLESIEDEEIRQRVEPVIKKWDAGVTRRFQELHSQLKPYQELGDPETLTEAQQLWELLNERPEDVYKGLAEALGYGTQSGQQGPVPQQPGQTPQQQQQTPEGLTQQQQQQFLQLPPEIQQQLEQQGKITEHLAQAYLEDQKAKQQAQEDQELESYLGNLKTEFGDFDEDYVLAKMLNGMDGAKAVKAYQKAVQKELAAHKSQNAPTILSGGGQVGQETVDVGQASSKDVKSLVAGLMAQAAGE